MDNKKTVLEKELRDNLCPRCQMVYIHNNESCYVCSAKISPAKPINNNETIKDYYDKLNNERDNFFNDTLPQ